MYAPPMEQLDPNTLPPLENMLCFSVYASSLAFNNLYRGLLTGYGLTYPQFIVLLVLTQKDGQKVSELGETLFLESNTLTPLLKRLEAAGFVTRKRDERDERVVRIHLTETGRALTKTIACVPPEVLEASSLTMAEAQALKARLNALAHSLRAYTIPKAA